MLVQELKSRLINRSKDGLANFSFISQSSTTIIDLKIVERYFLIDNIMTTLLNNKQLILGYNKNELIIKANSYDSSRLLTLQQEYQKWLLTIIDENQKEQFDFYDWLLAQQMLIKQKCIKINTKNQEINRETGVNCLRLGLIYAIGKCYGIDSDEVFRAPIFFIKIKIETSVTSKNLKIILSDEMELNDTFFEKLAFINRQKLDQLVINEIISILIKDDRLIDSCSKLQSALDLVISKIFKVFNIKINLVDNFANFKIRAFSKPSLRKKVFESLISEYNIFQIFNNATMAIFKTNSFEIIHDLEQWELSDANQYLQAMNNLSRSWSEVQLIVIYVSRT